MNFKSIKKRLVLVMALVLVVSSFGATFAASTFSDLGKAEWASPTIEKWTGYDLVAGYKDGTFRPNANITRAEFAVIAYNAFNLESKSGIEFDDVKASDWYYEQVVKMAKLGYIKGYTDGTFKPNMPITRAEAAAIIASIQGLTANEEGSKIFLDYEAIPTWARGHVGASAMAEFITGYSDDTFRASHTITRAESVAMLNNAVYGANDFANNWRVVEAGVYGGTTEKPVTVKGNVYIKSADVELKNVIIEGNLVFGKEIGEGEATIDGVVVKGETRVLGGGINSIHIKNSSITKLIVIKENNTIRIVAQGSTTIDSTVASSGVKLQEIGLTSGKGFTVVDIESLAGLAVEFVGLFDEITVDSADVKVVIPAGTVITSLVLDQAVEVTGKGTVTTAVVSVPGITFEVAPKAIKVESTENIEVEIAGETQEFKPGDATSTDATPAAESVDPTPAPVVKSYEFLIKKGATEVLVATESYDVTTAISLNMLSTIYDTNKEDYPVIAANCTEFFTELLTKMPEGETTYTFAYSLASRIAGYSGTLNVLNNLDTEVGNVLTGNEDLVTITSIATVMANASFSNLLADFRALYATDADGLSASGLIIKTSNNTTINTTFDGPVNGLEAHLSARYAGMDIADAAALSNIFSLELDGAVVQFVVREAN